MRARNLRRSFSTRETAGEKGSAESSPTLQRSEAFLITLSVRAPSCPKAPPCWTPDHDSATFNSSVSPGQGNLRDSSANARVAKRTVPDLRHGRTGRNWPYEWRHGLSRVFSANAKQLRVLCSQSRTAACQPNALELTRFRGHFS